MNLAVARRGVRDVAPLVLGVAPFGLVAGIAAVDTGLSLAEAVAMSVVVFAGASQLAALELLDSNAPLAVVVVTAAVINLRMVMYSASIAPFFRALSVRRKALLAYLLTDQAYVLSVTEYRAQADDKASEAAADAPTTATGVDRTTYYLSVAGTLWLVWQLTTVIGAVLGAGVPDAWGLEFAVPLVFLALLVPELDDVPAVAAAVVGGTVALVGTGLPLNLGLLVGATAGIAAGVVATGLGETEPETGGPPDGH